MQAREHGRAVRRPEAVWGLAMIRFLLALLLLAGMAGLARADGLDLAEAARDAQNRGQTDEAIRLYGEAIAAGGLSAENLAVIYNNRGIAYWSKGDLDKAISSYDEAIRIQPNYVEAYHNRAMAYNDGDRSEQAIKDYDTAIRLQPDDAFAYENRGRAKLHVGQLGPAVDDLARAVQLDPLDGYTVLWLHLARVWAGMDDAAEFSRNAGSLDRLQWPGPLLDLYLGAASAEKVRAAVAAAADPKTRREQTCEADFYVGAYELLRGARSEAKKLLQAAADGCPPYFLEATAAKAQLKRLGPQP